MTTYYEEINSIKVFFVLHKTTRQILYSTSKYKFLNFYLEFERFYNEIIENKKTLTQTEGKIDIFPMQDCFCIIGLNNHTYTGFIVDSEPTRFTRERLFSFGIRFESRLNKEIKKPENSENYLKISDALTVDNKIVTQIVDDIVKNDFFNFDRWINLKRDRERAKKVLDDITKDKDSISLKDIAEEYIKRYGKFDL